MRKFAAGRSAAALPICASFCAAAFFSLPALGVIRQPAAFDSASGDPAGPSQYFARWNNDAGAIAIGPNQVITTIHQGFGGFGTLVVFPSGPNVGSYFVTSSQQIGNADLQISTLNAPLATFAPLYTGSIVGQTVTIGGFGPTVGSTRYVDASSAANPKPLIGYNKLIATPNINSNPLLFGQNVIDSTDVDNETNGRVTPILVTDFDGPVSNPTIALNDPNRVALTTAGGDYTPPTSTNAIGYESLIGEGDSGGGWFINNSGTFQLAGLSHAATNATLPDGTPLPFALFGFQSTATDLRQFNAQINALVPEPASLAIVGFGGLLLRRRVRR